jgi:hypothetical protein
MKKYLKYAFIVAVCMSIVQCDDFGDINKNPNAAETPLTSALLTNALSTLGNTTASTTSGLYAQYFTETLYTDASRYSLQDISWNAELAGPIYDLQQIINFNTNLETAPLVALQGSNNNQIAIARIVKAYRYSVLTDRYGDMPYFDALKGNPQPKFDSQKEIYNDLFKELKEAVAQFDDGALVKGDILFLGDVDAWKKFANSLRVILALRVAKVDNTLGDAQFDDVMNNLSTNGGIIVDNSENVEISYPGGAFKNPWFGIGGDFAVTEAIANHVYNYGDRRALVFGNPGFDGFPYGLQRQDAITAAASIDESKILADTYRAEASTVFILTAADVTLARAEAAALNWSSEDEVALYEEGVELSWEQWNVFNQAAFDNYITSSLGGANILQTIRIQRWLTFYPNSPQGYSEWRRTGLPVLTPSPAPVNTSGKIPVRYIYPTQEYTYNGSNLNAAVTAQGADTQDTHVWWDVD